MNDFNISLVAGLDPTKSKENINQDIDKLKNSLNELALQAKIDPAQTKKLEEQLDSLKVKLNDAQFTQSALDNLVKQINTALSGIKIGNINIGNQAQKTGQQIGQQIGQQVNQNVTQAVSKTTNSVKRAFDELWSVMRDTKPLNAVLDKDGFVDASKTLDLVKQKYQEFGQVKITNQKFDTGELKSFKVNIEQTNGELKETRNFLVEISDKKKTLLFPDDIIKGAESYVHHLDEAKNLSNETGETLNAQKQKIAEQKKYYDKLKKDTKELYNLKQKLLSADKSETTELNKQIKSTKERISYSNKQIDKKGLRDNTLDRQVNDLVNSTDKKLNVKFAESLDSTSSNFTSLKEKWQEQGILVDDFKTKVETLEKSLNNISADDVSGLNAIKQQLSVLSSEADNLADVNKIQLSFANGNYEAKVESTIAKTQQWRDENGNARISTEQLRIALDNLGTAYNNLNADGGNTVENQKALKQAESELSTEIKKVTNEVAKMNAEYAKSSKVESFHQKLTEFYDKNSATHKKWGAELKQMMDATASGAKVTNSELLTMELRYKQIGNEARQTGKLGLSLFDGIKEQAKKFTQWVSITSVVMKSVQAVRGAVDNVIELDDALLELSKVSDLSAEGLENITNQAYELGEKVGKTGTQVLDAITTFKRAGFDITQSTYLAEDALKMTNVAEGITDAADSAQYLISIMKGYKDTSDEFATKILDSINEVSNTQAVDFDNLADGAQRLSAVANQSGVSFEQMLGTLTGGYEVLGNMEKTASGLITIFTRLQSIQLSDEEDVESVAKLQETFSNATNGVVNIVDQSTGQLRSAFDILKDLNTVWDTLDKNTQEGLAFAAGGTRQKSVFLSIMNNWQSVENSIQSATNSMGSADVENSKYLDSISGKVSQFDSAVQKLSKDVINSDLVKFFVDLGTIGVKSIDDIVNALTPLGTLAAGIGLFAGIKNVGIGMLVAY